jgi:hypothetical protein
MVVEMYLTASAIAGVKKMYQTSSMIAEVK